MGLDFSKCRFFVDLERKRLPYIDITRSSFSIFSKDILIPSILKSPVSYKNLYESASIKNDMQSYEKLKIPVNDTKAKIMLIAGSEDKVWHSLEMAKIIQKEKTENNSEVITHFYKGAGHIFVNTNVISSPDAKINIGGSKRSQ